MATINLAPKEADLLGAIIETMNVNFDWKLVAEKAGYNTPKQARDKWYGVRSKLTVGMKAKDGEKAAGEKPAGKKPTGNKRKDDNDPDDTETKPKTKRARGGKKGKKDASDEEETAVKAEPGEDDVFE